ncbi:hypothetical protein CC78DRAFT_549278 [Lojkania enalia]|uniref:Uncharacterized protein n=1 Tax=Lojkania enalia TaxID=147567 RepID=A0A9P4JYN0_9PLEO|nr:hypothetical protein CC78DRAFT_549278 [Didymosphaeria enalia]
MFVPRSVRLKGVPEYNKFSVGQGAPSVHREAVGFAADSQHIRANEERHTEHSDRLRGPQFTMRPITREYLAQLACGIELVFTDYAQQDKDGAQWLKQRHRTVDGEDKYIHLSAFLEHSNISTLKPVATQYSLQQAIHEYLPETLELSKNGYYIRRKPSSYPLPFIPKNVSSIVSDDGLGFWEQRTIYVEPHARDMCKTPAKVAHWLKEHGHMKQKWLPIQAVHTLYNNCAFVILSGNVTHADVWAKWRKKGHPENWKILTKVEHTKRTEEYLELRAKERPDEHMRNSRKGNFGVSFRETRQIVTPQEVATDETNRPQTGMNESFVVEVVSANKDAKKCAFQTISNHPNSGPSKRKVTNNSTDQEAGSGDEVAVKGTDKKKRKRQKKIKSKLAGSDALQDIRENEVNTSC